MEWFSKTLLGRIRSDTTRCPQFPTAYPLRVGIVSMETRRVGNNLNRRVEDNQATEYPTQTDCRRLAKYPRLLLCTALTGLFAAGCGFTPTDNNPDDGGGTNNEAKPFSFQIEVARHVDQPLSEQRVNRVFNEANAILLSDDNECPDVSCPVTFERSGTIDTFDNSPAIVTTEAQLDAVFDNPADIKIVTLMVGVCGSPSADDVSLVLGCAFTGGTAVLVQDAPSDVWAHEWGHVQGLPHRNDCDRNLMHAFELETNAVNETERDALLSPTPGQSFLAFKTIAEDEASSPAEMPEESASIDESATVARPLDDIFDRRYLAGLPSTLFDRHNLRVRSGELLDRFQTDPSPRCRANLARALGLSREVTACKSFLDSCESIAGELNIDELDELIEQIIALGRLADVDTTNQTTDLLLAGADPAFWTNRDLTLVLEDGRRINLDESLARVCVMGLGLTKNPAVPERLRELKSNAVTRKYTDPWFIPQIDEALERIAGTGKYAADAKRLRLP